MNFELIEPQEFDAYLQDHPLRDFSMSSKMDQVQKDNGWTPVYAAMKEDGKILCAAKLLSRQARMGHTAWRAPRGFLIDYRNKDLVKAFVNELSAMIKKENGYVLSIDPKIVRLQRDIDGNPVEGGENNEDITEFLKSIGFEHFGYYTGFDNGKQPQWVFVKDVKGLDEKALRKGFNSTTKWRVNRAAKFCTVRELGYDELYKLDDVIEKTGERRGFEGKDLAYYQHMYDQFHDDGQIKFMVCELNVPEQIAKLKSDHEKEVKKLDSINPESKKYEQQKKVIESVEKNLALLEEVRQNHPDEDVLVLSAAMFMLFGPDVEYYFSGSYEEFMHFNAQYLIQWEMIKYAAEHGFDRYNFLGITGNFNEDDPEFGVYKFKRGFGGYVEEYLSEFDLPLSGFYKLEKFARKVAGK